MSIDEVEEFASAGLPPFVRDPLGMVRRRWRWMAAGVLGGLVATGLVVLRLQPVFLAEASVLVERQQIPEDFVRPTVEEDSLQQIDAMVGRVLTHERLLRLVERHELYPAMRGSASNGELVGRVRGAIRIAPAESFARSARDSARIFTVQFEGDDPQTAAAVANEIAGLLPVESVRSRTRQAQLTTEFLRRELERAEAELREQSAAIREFKERYRGELPSELPANLGKLDRLQEQRQSLALQIAEASNRVTDLAQVEASTGGGPEVHLAGLKGDLARELSFRTDAHPNVIALRDEIARVEAEIAAQPAGAPSTPAALVRAEQGTLRELRLQLRQTESALAELDAQVARTPARAEELAALEEKGSVLRETYVEFLRKVQEAELAQNLEAAQHGERVSVLNWASVPDHPTQTRWKYLLVGVFAAFALGGALGVLAETFDPVMVSASQVESVTGLRVLGSVPRIS